MFEAKLCKLCGKEFVPQVGSQTFCCAEHRLEYNNERARERKIRKRLEAKRKKQKSNSLQTISNEARKLGMSYGQYVARMEMLKGVQA